MTTRVLAALLLLGPCFANEAAAQRNQPIYPAYDGFLKNADGTYTLAFGYFSHNGEDVTIAPGPDNLFTPEPGDRQQPVVFKPGHWRFQCVMVVSAEAAPSVRWKVTYAGMTTGTSERMLQSNWNLVEGAAELGRIDFKTAAKGVCLNRAPTVRLLGKTARKGEVTIEASTSEELHLFGSVHDEGLPRGRDLKIGWQMLEGPGKVNFSHPAAARTRASFTAPGQYVLQLTATDSEHTTSLRVLVTVS
jgi:hypothetical protein